MSDLQDLNRQASALLKASEPGRYWKERRKLGRKLAKKQRLELSLQKLRAAAATPTDPRPQPAFVYVIGCAGQPVKIGISADVTKRLAKLQTGFPHRLRVYCEVEVEDARAVEQECHSRLASRRLNGEWFDCEPADAIETVRAIVARFA